MFVFSHKYIPKIAYYNFELYEVKDNGTEELYLALCLENWSKDLPIDKNRIWCGHAGIDDVVINTHPNDLDGQKYFRIVQGANIVLLTTSKINELNPLSEPFYFSAKFDFNFISSNWCLKTVPVYK